MFDANSRACFVAAAWLLVGAACADRPSPDNTHAMPPEFGVDEQGLCNPTNWCPGGSALSCSTGCIDFTLTARMTYGPNTWYPSGDCACRPMKTQIPASLSVTSGNAGGSSNYANINYTIAATATVSPGANFSCYYKGASSGTIYTFYGCTNGQVSGQLVNADRISLHIVNGLSSAGPTEIAATFQEYRPTCTVGSGSANVPPVVSSNAPTSAIVGQLYLYEPTATDQNSGDSVTFSVAGPANMNRQAGPPQKIYWIPQSSQLGANSVTVTAQDNHGSCSKQDYTLTVYPANAPPTITSTAPRNATQHVQYLYAVAANDANGDALTFGLDTAPSGMTISSTTGLIRWTPGEVTAGPYSVHVWVRDPGGLTATQSFSITVAQVNDPPAFTSTPPATATEGYVYQYTAVASDPDSGDSVTYSLGTHPSGMVIFSSTGVVAWVPGEDQIGPNSVRVVATDQGGLTAVQDFTITVANENDAPVITSSPNTTAYEDGLYNYHLTATDSDIGDLLLFSLTNGPPGMTINAASGDIAWSPVNADVGMHAVTCALKISFTRPRRRPSISRL